MAAKYGATHTINSAKEDFSEAVLKILGGSRPAVVVDGTAIRKCWQAYALADDSGRCIGVGVMPHDRTLPQHLSLHLGKTCAVHGRRQPARRRYSALRADAA